MRWLRRARDRTQRSTPSGRARTARGFGTAATFASPRQRDVFTLLAPRDGVALSAMDGFDARKAQVIAGLRSEAPDKSPKGGLDAPCAALVQWLNAQRDVCTTSSCSGRVSLFAHAPGRAKGGRWAYISHERAAAEEVAAAFAQTLAESSSAAAADDKPPGDVVLRFEPFILTAECRTRDAGLQARRGAGRARNAALSRRAAFSVAHAAGGHGARRRLPRVRRGRSGAARHRHAALLHPPRGTRPLLSHHATRLP